MFDFNNFDNFNTFKDQLPFTDQLFISNEMLIIIGLIASIATIFVYIGTWKVLEKGGKAGWTSIVPNLNTYKLLQISKLPEWYIVFVLIPWVGPLALFVLSILIAINIAKAFKQDMLFTIGLILLPFIFYPILGLGKKYEYNANLIK